MTILGDSQRSNRTFVDPHDGFFSFPPFCEAKRQEMDAGGNAAKSPIGDRGSGGCGSDRSRQRSTSPPNQALTGIRRHDLRHTRSGSVDGRSQQHRSACPHSPPLWRQEGAGYISVQEQCLSSSSNEGILSAPPSQRRPTPRHHIKSSSVSTMPCSVGASSRSSALSSTQTRWRREPMRSSVSASLSRGTTLTGVSASDRSTMRLAPSPKGAAQEASKMGGVHSRLGGDNEGWQDKQRGLQMVVGLMGDEEESQEKVRRRMQHDCAAAAVRWAPADMRLCAVHSPLVTARAAPSMSPAIDSSTAVCRSSFPSAPPLPHPEARRPLLAPARHLFATFRHRLGHLQGPLRP